MRHEIAHTGCRRLLALIKGMPEDAACIRQDRPGWTVQDEMAAMAVEVADGWGRAQYSLLWAINTKKPLKLPDPIVIRTEARDALRAKHTKKAKPVRRIGLEQFATPRKG